MLCVCAFVIGIIRELGLKPSYVMRISFWVFVKYLYFLANEPPDPAMEQAGILSLQAQELTVDHSVSFLRC